MAGDHDAMESSHVHDEDTGMYRPAFPAAEGSVPTASQANSLNQASKIVARSDMDFVNASFVSRGDGSLEDPYVIEGWRVTGDLFLENTDACVIVRENYIQGQLTLNWNGPCVHAHHNYINDLRVNENTRRTGFATGGLIELNEIQIIGQLRHYDGEFRDNVAGPVTTGFYDEVLETVPWLFGTDTRVANIDGFNQGWIHDNTFHGTVDLDLHGHHHSTGFFATHSHYHGDDMNRTMPHDHTDRWTSVVFERNKVIDDVGYGLRYEDQNHAGDDRKANSEQEETLTENHLHHVDVAIRQNVIEGGQIWIDVFSAKDKLHDRVNEGWLAIEGNIVELHERDSLDLMIIQFGDNINMDAAIDLSKVREVQASVSGNILRYVALEESETDVVSSIVGVSRPIAAIDLRTADLMSLDIRDNVAEGFDIGFRAGAFDDSTTKWTLDNNDWGSATEQQIS